MDIKNKQRYIYENIDSVNNSETVLKYFNNNKLNYTENSNGVFINISILEDKHIDFIYLFVKNKKLPEEIANMNRPLYKFLINKWYFDEFYEVIIIKPSKKLGLFFWKFCDGKIIDGFGPDGISSFIKKCSIKANKFQSGFIYQYAFVMLLGFSALLTFLIVK